MVIWRLPTAVITIVSRAWWRGRRLVRIGVMRSGSAVCVIGRTDTGRSKKNIHQNIIQNSFLIKG